MPSKKTPSKTTPKAAKAAVGAPQAAEQAQRALFPAAPVEAAVTAQQETLETLWKAGSQAAAKGYEQVFALTQEQIEKVQQTVLKRYDEAASFGKDNVEACVQSGTRFAKGVESLGKELMSLAQSAAEANLATARALFGAKTLREVIDLQTEFSRRRFDALLAESAKLTEIGLALAQQTAEPLQARLNATVEKLVKPAA